jgi:hypothetical protein
VVAVQAHHALFDPVQHRLTLLDKAADLDRFKSEGLALHPAAEQQ